MQKSYYTLIPFQALHSDHQMKTYQRLEYVEANPTDDGNHMLIFPISSVVGEDGILRTPDPYLLPADVFHKNYVEVPTLSLLDTTMNDQVAEFLKEPFIGEGFAAVEAASAASAGFSASAGTGIETQMDDAEAFSAGRPIVDLIIHRIPDAIDNFKGFISVEMLLWGAEVAFDFAIGKLPFPIPETVKNNLWSLIEQAIRSIWAEHHPAPA